MLDCEALRQLYVEQRLTITEVAEQLNMSSSGISSALMRCEIPRRNRPLSDHEMSDEVLQGHVAAGLSNAEIAAKVNVSEFAVRQRLGRSAIVRPAPMLRYPLPDVEELKSLVARGDSLAAIARRFRVPARTVPRWLERLGVAQEQRNITHGDASSIDVASAAVAYQEGTAAAVVAQSVGVSRKTLLFKFHNHGIAVRPSGPAHPSRPAQVLLEELYDDPQVQGWLERHQIPRRGPGPFRQRWPMPWPITDQALLEGKDLGLSRQTLTLLTGATTSHLADRYQLLGQ